MNRQASLPQAFGIVTSEKGCKHREETHRQNQCKPIPVCLVPVLRFLCACYGVEVCYGQLKLQRWIPQAAGFVSGLISIECFGFEFWMHYGRFTVSICAKHDKQQKVQAIDNENIEVTKLADSFIVHFSRLSRFVTCPFCSFTSQNKWMGNGREKCQGFNLQTRHGLSLNKSQKFHKKEGTYSWKKKLSSLCWPCNNARLSK